MDYRYWGWVVFGKMSKGTPTLEGKQISKKAQKTHDIIINKLFQSNIWWNDWKFQLHWNMIEWVDLKSTPKRVKPFQFLQKSYILIITIEQLIL